MLYIHVVAVYLYQYQAAVALLIFGTDFSILGSAPCGILLIGLFKIVSADYCILRVERKEFDTAGR